MAKKSRLLQILFAAEDLLLFFNDYFKSTSWIYYASDMPKNKVKKTVWHYIDKDVLNKNLSLNKKPKTIYKEIVEPWDGFWRIITYDIEEKNRNVRYNIRHHLKQYDFKSLQRSVWVSPISAEWIIRSLEKNINDPQKLLSFKAQISKNQSKLIIDQLWNLNEWEMKAESLLKSIKEDGTTKSNRKKFWNLVIEHPRIPLDLLPSSWPLKKLTSVFTISLIN